jgi:hypothetical protein
MSSTLRFMVFTVLLVAMLVAWQSTVAHLYNPTVRTPLPAPRTTSTPNPAELSIRIYHLAAE